jgi:hypothetical protein
MSNRNLNKLSLDELRALAEQSQAGNLEQLIRNPHTDEETRREAITALHDLRRRNGQDPATGQQTELSRVQNLSTDQLKDEWRTQTEQAVAEAKSERELQIATNWTAHQIEYDKTPQNAQLLLGYLQERGLPVSEVALEQAFQDLTASGRMKRKFVPPTPQKIYTADELREFSTEQIRELAGEQGAAPMVDSDWWRENPWG